MKSVINVDKGQVYFRLLKIFNGLFHFSEREIDVMAKFMAMHEQLLIKDAYSIPGVELFSAEIRKQIAEDLGIKPNFLVNIVSGLRKKGMIIERKMTLVLHPQLEVFVLEKMKAKNSISVTINIVEQEVTQKAEE